MKAITLFIIMIASAQMAMGQVRTTKLTVYKQYKPSIIQLKDGRQIKQPLTNVFLKNSALLYMHGANSMQANMDNVVSVKFDDRLYVKIDTLLAYAVDSVGNDKLYKATIIDQEAYRTLLANNQVITNLSLGEQISTSTIDISSDDDFKFPLIDVFYFLYNGKFVKVHERHLSRVLDKEKRRIMKSHMSLPNFSWTDEKALANLLKSLQ